MSLEVTQGTCDLCGGSSDAAVQECNWLSCTFQHCDGGLYHQECLEKYLKSNKLEKNRKTGFKCPRGCGKGTKFDLPCPGRIDKSHPIHPRNEDAKKKKLQVVVEPPRPAKAVVPVATNGKVAKAKDDKQEAGKEGKKDSPPAKSPPSGKAPAAPAAAPSAAAAAKAGAKKEAPLPPRPELAAKQKLAELAAQARREIGLSGTGSMSMPSVSSKGDLSGLASTSSGSIKVASVPAPSAWGKAAAAAPEPPPVTLSPPTLAQLPQLQQLLQQAANKKQLAKPAAAIVGSSASSAAKPAPAVPQPVLNPPTPVWPALPSSQASAASLVAASTPSTSQQPSTSAGQTPREGTPRPPSPASAWGAAPAPPASPAPPSAAAGQPGPAAQQLSPPSSSPAAAPPAPSPPSTPPRPAASAQPAASAAAGSLAPTVSQPTPALGSVPSPAASATPPQPAALATAVPAGQGPPPSRMSGGGAGPPTCSRAAVAVIDSPSPAGPPLVGAEYADDEVKEQRLTKSQKKNLKRAEKKKGPVGSAGATGALESAGGSGGQEGEGAAALGTRDSAGSAAGRAAAGAGASGAGAAPHRRHLSRSSDDAHIAEAEQAQVMEELCINCIVARKMVSLITKLQRLGVLEFLAAAAIQRHGSNILSALEWLLLAGADAAAASPQAVLAAAAESSAAADCEIDISDELQQLGELQAAMGVPTELLQQCVLDCNGDVQTAANTAMERMLAAPSSPSAAGQGVGGSIRAGGGGGGRGKRVSSASSSSTSPPGGGGMGRQQSASFYSVSSADHLAMMSTSSSAVHLHELHQQGQAQLPQPPAFSSHFGVRLQEEDGGGYGQPVPGYGYEGPAASLLQGGVAAGVGIHPWPNGAQATTPGGSARSTSRLMHWLKDDAGRVAAMEGEGGKNGMIRSSDPVLDSPFAAHGDALRGLAPSGAAASDSPSLHSWLSSNGYHHGAPSGGVASAELCGPGRSGFSFMSALSRQAGSMTAGAHGTHLEPVPEYGARWGALGGGAMQQRPDVSPTGVLSAAAVTSDAESAQHVDGDDLNSIMALIVR